MTSKALALVVWDELATHRARALLGVLSILVGVATLTAIIGLGDLAQAATRATVERQVGRPATLQISTEGDVVAFARDVVPRVGARLSRYGVRATTPDLAWAVVVGTGETRRPEALSGVSVALPEVRSVQLVAGRWLADADDQSYGPVLVLNRVAAADLGGVGPGTLVSLEAGPVSTIARIVGTMDDGSREANVYTSASRALALFGPSSVSGASVLARVDPVMAAPVQERLLADLSAEGVTNVVVRRVDGLDSFGDLFTILQILLGAIAMVSLVAGAIGILNLGLVTARERATEFALRRAFGATSRDIMAIIITETAATTAIGGLLGVAIAGLLVGAASLVVAHQLTLPNLPGLPVGAAVLGISMSVVVGAVAGIAPARLATRLSIIATIRG